MGQLRTDVLPVSQILQSVKRIVYADRPLRRQSPRPTEPAQILILPQQPG